MHRIALFLMLCVPLTSIAQTASAPEEEAPNKPKVEETIVVTATRGEREVSELPVSATVISAEKLETAPATTVDELLRTVAGVHIPLLGGGSVQGQTTRMSMHGLGGTRALVLLDGVPIHDPFYGTVQWQKVPLDTLRQIEVVRGGTAGLFGNYALGGTINLLTRPVEESEIRVDAAWGNMNSHRQSLRIDHPINDSLGVRLSHNRSDTDGFYVFVTPGPLDTPSWSNSSVTSARLDFRPSNLTTTYLKANRSEIEVSAGQPIGRSDRTILDIAAGVQQIVGRSGLFSSTFFHQHEDIFDLTATALAGGPSFYPSVLNETPTSSTGGSFEWSTQRNASVASLTFGTDINVVKIEDDGKTFNSSGAMTRELIVKGRQRFVGVFGQASWRPTPRLEVLTTLRVDQYHNQQGSETEVGGNTTIHPETKATQLDPRVSFRYSLAPGMVLRGSAYRAFKAPILRDLYVTNRGRSGTTLANPSLQPETLIGAETGLEWEFARANVAVNLYRSDVEGLAVRVGVGPGLLQFQNLGKIRSQGVEVMASALLSRRWSIDASYTWADSVIVEDPDAALEGKLVPDVVPHIGSLSVRFRADRGTTLDVRGRSLSRSYGDPTNRFPQPAHQVFDISLSHPLRSWLTAYVQAENVFDEVYFYALSTGVPRAARPRSYMGGVRFRIDSLFQPR